jgi:hypothetical protein
VVATDHDDFDWREVAESSTPVLDTHRRLPPGPSFEHL